MPRCSALRVLLVLLALVVAGSVSMLPLRAAPLEKLTVERIHSDPALAGDPPQRLLWHPDGKRLTFLRRAGAGDAQSLFALEVTRGGERLLVDGAKLQAPGEPPRPLPLAACSWLADGNTLLVPALGDVFTVDVRTGAVRALLRTKEDEQHAEASPDGRRVAFVRGHDLFVVDVASGRETRLTQGGSDTLLNGKLDWVYEEELASRSGQAFVWSPDSNQLAYLQLDQARVPDLPDRGLRAGAQRGRVAALPQGGRSQRDRAPRRRRHHRGRPRGPRAAPIVRARRRLHPSPARLDARLARRRVPAPEPRPEPARAASAARARGAGGARSGPRAPSCASSRRPGSTLSRRRGS